MNARTRCERLTPTELQECQALANWIIARYGMQTMIRIMCYRKMVNLQKYLLNKRPWKSEHLHLFRLFLPDHEIARALDLQNEHTLLRHRKERPHPAVPGA